MNSINAKYN